MRRAPLTPAENLFDFFHERVETAARHRRAPVSEDAVYYLSNLLAEQGRSGDQEGGATTLVELRARAANGSFAESVTLYRRLGDQALMGVGYYREHLRQRRISPEYYAEMGRGAYAALARMLGAPAEGADVYGELAARFVPCSEVIAEVRDDAREHNSSDIVRLYEEWLETSSPRAAERLRQLGVVPVRFPGAS